MFGVYHVLGTERVCRELLLRHGELSSRAGMLAITHFDGQQDPEPLPSFTDQLAGVARNVDQFLPDSRRQPNTQLLSELVLLKAGHDMLGRVGLVVLVEVVPNFDVGILGQIPGMVVWLTDPVPLTRWVITEPLVVERWLPVSVFAASL
jgi:hypothetical protein